ncbi:MAG TPA: peptidoglycan-binding domain-containing protein [Planctomycetota bacterium]|nr:peptidoglycan-binding domain-containing protein [Planctomycetota bacterium]
MTASLRILAGTAALLPAIALSGALLGGCHARQVDDGDAGAKQGASDEKGLPADPTEGPPAETERAEMGVVARPEALLRPGAVRQIEQSLIKKGYLKEEVHQEIDPATQAALMRFQKDAGVAATGFPDALTLKKLGLDPKEVYASPSGDPAQ